MNNNHYVYFHKNKINGKMYIGQCKGAVERRWRSNGDGYINRCSKFSDAIKKYGWDNFEHGILKEKLTGYSLNEVICMKEPESKKIGSFFRD